MAADRRIREKLEGAFAGYLESLVAGTDLASVTWVEGRDTTDAEELPCVAVVVDSLRVDPPGSGCYEFELRAEARIHCEEPEGGVDPEVLNSERVGLLTDWLADEVEALAAVNVSANALHVQGFLVESNAGLIADPVLLDRVVIRGHAVPWSWTVGGYAFGGGFSAAFKIA